MLGTSPPAHPASPHSSQLTLPHPTTHRLPRVYRCFFGVSLASRCLQPRLRPLPHARSPNAVRSMHAQPMHTPHPTHRWLLTLRQLMSWIGRRVGRLTDAWAVPAGSSPPYLIAGTEWRSLAPVASTPSFCHAETQIPSRAPECSCALHTLQPQPCVTDSYSGVSRMSLPAAWQRLRDLESFWAATASSLHHRCPLRPGLYWTNTTADIIVTMSKHCY